MKRTKKRVSKRTQALMIHPETRIAVTLRDNGLCLWCGRPGRPEAHFIPRSQSGLGIEQNILTLCRPCHDRFDFSPDRERMRIFFMNYLKRKYPNWDEKNLVYRKGVTWASTLLF
jgi:5-methylcytosine-specific restriction endonuclease McrA